MDSKKFIYTLIIFGIIFIYFYIKRKFKFPKVGAMAMVTGGVKCGKSTFAVGLLLSEHRRRKRAVKIKNFFRRLFKRREEELPLIYSNIPLSVPYVPLTEDLLLRKKRFVYGSVIYVNEASLVADSQLIFDMDTNERLLLFNKLIGHECKGGCLIYDTQAISDVHYSVKRCLSEYFYIHHLYKWIPFFLVATVRECRYSDDGSVIAVEDKDTEETLRRVIIRKSTWKKFDAYCFSSLTDDLPVEREEVLSDTLKVNKVFSFREYPSLVAQGKQDPKPKQEVKWEHTNNKSLAKEFCKYYSKGYCGVKKTTCYGDCLKLTKKEK